MAVLALYVKNRAVNETLEDYLDYKVFTHQQEETIQPEVEDVQGFEKFMLRYMSGLEIELAAIKALPSHNQKK